MLKPGRRLNTGLYLVKQKVRALTEIHHYFFPFPYSESIFLSSYLLAFTNFRNEGHFMMRQKLLDKIRKKEQEISGWEKQIHDAKIYIDALQESMRLIPKEGKKEGRSASRHDEKASALKEGTDLAKARDALLKTGKPLHIDEILEKMGRPADKKARLSLAGSISGYARKGRIFRKAGKNIFTLIDLQKSGSQDADDEEGAENRIRIVK